MTSNDNELEDTTNTLGDLMQEVNSGMDACSTQQFEMNLQLIASLEETVEDIAQTSNENFDAKMADVNEYLVAIKDEFVKSVKTNATLAEQMNVLNQNIIELVNQLKAQKISDASKSHASSISPAFPHRVNAEDYDDQRGTIRGADGKIGYFDDGDYLTYSNVDFGPKGTTTSIRMHFAKGKHNGKVEIRLGGPTGRMIAEWYPHITHEGIYDHYTNLDIGINDVEGVHNLSFVGRGDCGIMNLDWFELFGHIPSKISFEIYPHVHAKDYTYQRGTVCGNRGEIGHFDDGDYLVYSRLNFGLKGTTKTIRVRYAKGPGKFVGKVEVRLGGPMGRMIANWTPDATGGYGVYRITSIDLDAVEGVHDLSFVGRFDGGIVNLDWFELCGHA